MKYLEFWRRSRHLTQRGLAALLGPGFSEASVSLLESGRLQPSTRQQAALRALFGDKAATLFDEAPCPNLSADEIGAAS